MKITVGGFINQLIKKFWPKNRRRANISHLIILYLQLGCKRYVIYTLGCLPVRGDNPHALASGLSPRTGRQLWHSYFIPPYISVDLAHHKIFHAKVGKGGINVVVCLFKQSVAIIGPKMLDMIWVQTVCHFDDNPDFFLS